MNRPLPKPPRLAGKLFAWYCNRANIEDLHGDIEELFYQDVKKLPAVIARLLYWKHVVSLMLSYSVRARKYNASYHHFAISRVNAGMIKNYFKTGTRNLARNKFFTVLNALALALGMSLSLMFIALLSFIYRFDDFHSNKDRIFRVTTQLHDKVDNPEYASAPVGVAEKLKHFTGIEKVLRVQASIWTEARYGEKKIPVDGYFVEPEFLEVFDFPLLKGNASTLADPNTILITRKEAERIFGSKDPLGEVLTIEPFGDFQIAGVLADIPLNSQLRFGVLASYSSWLKFAGMASQEDEKNWQEFNDSFVYLLLPPDADGAHVNDYLDQVAREKYARNDVKASFKLQSMDDAVRGSSLRNPIGRSWDLASIVIVGSMTLIVLIPACSNYIHLSISQSLNRMKEIGVRKVMGGQKKQIFFQFITETVVMMLIALALSYLIFEVIRVDFLEMVEVADSIDLTPTWETYAGFIVFALCLACLAGTIPALYFSKIGPINALKGKLAKFSNKRFTMRKAMITLQFAISLGFIMAVAIAMKQYRYSVNYDFGFNEQNTLDVELQGADPQIFKNEFEKLSCVQGISMSSGILGAGSGSKTYFKIAGDATDSIETSVMSVDENFIPGLGLKLLSGRNFTDNAQENLRTIIVNEEFVKKLNIEDGSTPLERTVVLADGREVRIGGVVKNFHYANLLKPITSFFFECNPGQFRYANVKIHSADIIRDISAMEQAWKKLGREDKLQAKFFDDEIDEAYSFYFVMIRFWSFLGFLAITVACLGLLGTVVFTVKNRVKEVSIRKVMGASSESVALLLSRNFILLLGIATFITTPTIYFGLDYLLSTGQYYRAPIGFAEIFVSIAIMTVLCLVTIFSQTIKAANTNPAENLRIE